MTYRNTALAAAILWASLSVRFVAEARPLGVRFQDAPRLGLRSTTTSPSWNGRDPKLVEFDPPGSAKTSSSLCKPYCGTTSNGINAEGTIAGYFTDAKVVPHAFIRNRRGDILVFNAPGAGLGAFLYEGTYALSINDRDVVAGYLEDAHLRYHGFIRFPNGKYATVDAPGAGTNPNQGTYVTSVNDRGETAGGLYDAKDVGHAFVRTAEGKLTQFDPPGAVFSEVTGLNARGATTGFYYDASNVERSFVRQADGTLVTIDAPGANMNDGGGTQATSIDFEGAISGFFSGTSGEQRSFVRLPNARFVTFAVPGSYATLAGFVNDFGAVVGGYFDAQGLHGFERSLLGEFCKFSAPGAGTKLYQGTIPVAINDAGVIAGWWRDRNYVAHGFVRYR